MSAIHLPSLLPLEPEARDQRMTSQGLSQRLLITVHTSGPEEALITTRLSMEVSLMEARLLLIHPRLSNIH